MRKNRTILSPQEKLDVALETWRNRNRVNYEKMDEGSLKSTLRDEAPVRALASVALRLDPRDQLNRLKAKHNKNVGKDIQEVDPAVVTENLDKIFKTRIPGFEAGEGVWPTNLNGWDTKIKGGFPERLVWSTDANTGERTVDIHVDEFVVNGFGERKVAPEHVISYSGSGENPRVFVGADYDPGDITSKPMTEVQSSDGFTYKSELLTIYNTWINIIDDPQWQEDFGILPEPITAQV